MQRLGPSGFHPSRRRAPPAISHFFALQSNSMPLERLPFQAAPLGQWYGVYQLMAGLGWAAKCAQLVVSDCLKTVLSQ